MRYVSHYQSKLGPITLASDGERITGLWFDEQKYDRAGLDRDAIERELPVFDETKHWLDLYFAGQVPKVLPPLSFVGTEFQKEVWQILLEIPYGKTTTYGEIARKLSEKKGIASMSAQAVGGAVGHNKISILVPCHRVIGRDGKLTGYAGGLEKKLWMLQIERIRTMEEKYDKALRAIEALDEAFEKFQTVIPEIKALIAYYESETWRDDFDADSEGKLPIELKRGVLSEDGVYNLLTDYDRLKRDSKMSI